MMRTSGGRGTEGLIMAIPILALLMFTSMSHGGVEGMLFALEGAIRRVVTSVLNLISELF